MHIPRMLIHYFNYPEKKVGKGMSVFKHKFFATDFLSFFHFESKHKLHNKHLPVRNSNGVKWCKICSKLTMNTSEDIIDVVLVTSELTLNMFCILLYCFFC